MSTRLVIVIQSASQFAAILRPIAIVTGVFCVPFQIGAQAVPVDPASMPRIAAVDERFASYNVEMAEVTGGNFWKPYGANAKSVPAPAPSQATPSPVGMNPNMYQYRPPIDLSNPRLRKLAAALGPAYVRVSGTLSLIHI